MENLYTGILEAREVKTLLAKTSREIGTILLIGFNTGMDLGEVLWLKQEDIKADEIRLMYRTVIIPQKMGSEVREYIIWRKMKGHDKVWSFKDLGDVGTAYQSESMRIIGKPISWKAVRRTYVWHGSAAGYPTELLENNTGTDHKYLRQWIKNNRDYKKLVNESSLYR